MASEKTLKMAYAFDSDTTRCPHMPSVVRGDCVKCMADMIAEAQREARAEAFLEAADEADKHGYVHQAVKSIRALATRARQ